MKKLFAVGALSAGLVACGGGGGSDSGSGKRSDSNQINTPASNVLTIKGEGVDKQEQVTVTEKDIFLVAMGNQPMRLIGFQPKSKQSQSQVAGAIRLLPESLQAGLVDIWLDKDGKTLLACQSGNVCEDNSSYSLQTGSQQSLLNINFNQSPNSYIVQQNGQSIPLPVKVSGNLQFGIPANWPVMQAKRFPVMDIKGSLVWNGKPYRLDRLGSIPRIWWGGPRTISLYFKSVSESDKTLNLRLDIDSNDALHLSVDDEESSYSFFASSYKNYVSESDNELRLKLNKLPLFDFDENKLVLSSDLQIPKLRSDVSFNGHNTFEDVAGILGTAENASKTYSVDFQSGGWGVPIETTHMRLTQEIDGHVWMSYGVRNKEYVCGSVKKACSGLSVDADQKTWRFNNVDLFKDSGKLNGTLYIPGIIE